MKKIIVCVKYCDGDINPFDACALECALATGSDDITVVSMLPPSAAPKLRALTRYPVRETVLLSDAAFAGSDTVATSYILSEFIKSRKPDLVLCGRQSVDGDTAQTGAMIAARLGYDLHTNVLEFDEKSCRTRLSAKEKIKYPALLTVERINTLRFFSIRSKERDITILSAASLGLDTDKCGQKGSPTIVRECFENSAGRRTVKFIKPSELRPLIAKLSAAERATAKKNAKSGEKLPEVFVVGEEMLDIGKSVAKKVVVVNEKTPEALAKALKSARVALFPADLRGRTTAPVVAALLSTGLCADCTKLEVRDGKFYMYRPARSGNIIAKIECRTEPVMATVRMPGAGGEIIVTAGRGAADDIDSLREFANSFGAELCASRCAVDDGLLPYESQVGLTGRTVAPKIYIAVGVSGAVHHTCAYENSGTVIAINPDRDARIFDYADFGIVATAEEAMKS